MYTVSNRDDLHSNPHLSTYAYSNVSSIPGNVFREYLLTYLFTYHGPITVSFLK
jgi:hypothetical protein